MHKSHILFETKGPCRYGIRVLQFRGGEEKENSRPTPTFSRNNMYGGIPTCACTARTRFLHRVLFRRTREIKKGIAVYRMILFAKYTFPKSLLVHLLIRFFFKLIHAVFFPYGQSRGLNTG